MYIGFWQITFVFLICFLLFGNVSSFLYKLNKFIAEYKDSANKNKKLNF